MEQVTTYRVQGKTIGLVFLFKYCLNGHLRVFEVAEGELTDEQMKWLFSTRFPATEDLIKSNWLKNADINKKFTITVAPPDLSFDALWELYDYKVSKADAVKTFNKLKESEVIRCFVMVPKYLDWLKRSPNIGKLHLATYMNKRRFEDELPGAPPVYKKPFIGKNTNPMLGDLAAQKTMK